MGKSVPLSVRPPSVHAPQGDARRRAGSAVFPGGSRGCLRAADGGVRVGTRFAPVFGGVVYAKPQVVVDVSPF
jgi:hypothetical protein